MEEETPYPIPVNTAKQKVDQLLSLDKITPQDTAGLSPGEIQYMDERLTGMLADLQGTERDKFLDQITPIICPVTKAQLWEHNQFIISTAVADFIDRYGTMPTKNQIAEKTGFSRQTVAKHMRDYQAHPNFKEALEQFKFMNPKMLASVFQSGINGNMRAARLYFEMTGALSNKRNATVVNGQTNYIQINNTILNQEKLHQLTAAQLNQIEQIITNG